MIHDVGHGHYAVLAVMRYDSVGNNIGWHFDISPLINSMIIEDYSEKDEWSAPLNNGKIVTHYYGERLMFNLTVRNTKYCEASYKEHATIVGIYEQLQNNPSAFNLITKIKMLINFYRKTPNRYLVFVPYINKQLTLAEWNQVKTDMKTVAANGGVFEGLGMKYPIFFDLIPDGNPEKEELFDNGLGLGRSYSFKLKSVNLYNGYPINTDYVIPGDRIEGQPSTGLDMDI